MKKIIHIIFILSLININPIFCGEMPATASTAKEELPVATQLQLDLEKYTKELTDIRLELEGLSASEKSIMSLMKIANDRLTEATSSSAEISKNKTSIIHEEDDEAQKSLNKIIELYGELKESSEYLGRLEESFNSQMDQIEKNKSDIEKRVEDLQENVKKLEDEIKQLKEKEEAPTTPRKVKKATELTWYENIIIYLGNSIKWAKSFFVDVDPTPTEPTEFHEMPVEKPAKELLENIVTDTGTLVKRGFRKVGSTVNKIVQKSDELQKKLKDEITADTKPTEEKAKVGSAL